jgi:hypothetical protein
VKKVAQAIQEVVLIKEAKIIVVSGVEMEVKVEVPLTFPK